MNSRSIRTGPSPSQPLTPAAETPLGALATPAETTRSFPQLLVSFRSLEELNDAIVSQIDLIDLKEPQDGSLAAVSSQTIFDVHHWLGGRRPLSVALGELVDYQPERFTAHLDHANFAKLGLAGVRSLDNGKRVWREAIESFPKSVVAVAVAYADHASCDSWSPEVVLEMAANQGCHYFLLDTFAKQHGSVFDHVEAARLRSLYERAQSAGIRFALAGSLRLEHVAHFVDWIPEIVAVRGAVTRGDRTTEIDPEKVEQFHRRLADCRLAMPAQLIRSL